MEFDDAQATLFPLSAAQRGIWFAQHLAGDVPISIAQFVEIHGNLDVERLTSAAMTAGREFGTGYLRLVEVDGHPMQTVDPTVDDSVPYLDLRAETDPVAAAHAWMFDEYSAPIDPLRDRLVSMAVLRVGEARTFWYSRIHHIALDGYGAMTLLKRCAELYTSGSDAPASRADDLKCIVDADELYRASDRFHADRDYWSNHLAGLADPVSLAGRAAPAGAHPRVHRGELDESLTSRLEAVSVEVDSSVAPLTVAAFAAYLARATDSTEVTLSLPVSARTTAALRRSGGMVANVVPLRLRLGPTTSVSELVRDAQLELTGALRRQRYRQEDIARDLGAPASGFGPSVNMMMFDTRIMLGEFVGRLHVLTSGMIDDLFVNVYPGIGGSSTHIDFQANRKLYSADDLARHHRAFLAFLTRFLENPSAPVIGLSMTDDDAVLRGRESVSPRTLPDILAAAVARNPEGIAVSTAGGDTRYRELDAQSNRLARSLIARGACIEGTVAVMIPRSTASIVAMWAVAKTGAAFVPIDPSYPAERIDYLLNDSDARLIVDAEFMNADHTHYSDAPVTDADRSASIRPSNAAYVIYTSGSTGQPKGVVVSHHGLADLVADGIDRLEVTETSRLTHAYSPSFDASLSELLLAFGAAATVVVVPLGVYGGDELTKLLRAQSITHTDVTPAVLGTLDAGTLPQLTHAIVGGDACPPELLARWAGEKTLINGYGPTEMTVTSTYSRPMTPSGPVTIGEPIAGTSAVVLDRWLQPVADGSTGELYLSGAAMARGYHRRAAVTASRFVASPFAAGDRLYRTGDLVRRTADGQLDYRGRSDFQVKIRGFRIELGEVDAALHAAALDSGHDLAFAMTVGHRTDSGATVLVSYVQGSHVDTAEIGKNLDAALPAYMVPSSIMVLESVPLTSAGKVDRRALPAPIFAAHAGSRKPFTRNEIIVAGLFEHVLGARNVGADDSFFALGGDSIVSIQLVSRAKAAGLVFTARDVFERKTVAGLAEIATAVEAAPILAELDGGGIGNVPITPIVAEMVAAGNFRTYSQAVLISLPADVTDDALRAATQQVIDHHDALRSRFTAGHDILPRGSVGAADVFTATTVDLDAALNSAANRLDPGAGRVIQLARVDDRLWIVLHHLAVDGVSWRILLPDFAAAVSGVAPAPIGTSLRRWAHGLADAAADRISELPRWTEIVDTPDPLLASRTLDVEIDTVSTRAELVVAISTEVTETVSTTLPDRFGCGPNDALLTALALAVARWRTRSSISVLLEGHGREQQVVPGADLSRTLGWFTTVFPVALDLAAVDLLDAFAGGPAAGAALKIVKEHLAAVPDHGIGYGMLRHLGGAAELVGTPQISFNYLGRVHTASATPWMPMRFASHADAAMPLAAPIDINIVARQHDAATEFEATFAYAGLMFDRSDIGELALLFQRALEALAVHVASETGTRHTPSDFPLAATTQQDIDDWEDEFPSLTDVWPLSPLQEGLLFHAVFDADGPDSYIVQSILTLAGTVDAGRLHDAAQALVDRHDNLRVAFRERDSGPRQIVLDQLDVSWTETDLREHEDIGASIESILEADRATRFDMATPPLMRFALIRTAEDGYRLLMTNHHILLDGWSTPLLVQELLTLYAAFDGIGGIGGIGGMRPARSYREYLGWLAEQDRNASRCAWQNALAGVEAPTLVSPDARLTADTASGEHSRSLGPDVTAAVHALTRTHGITVNTAIQTAWAIMLSSLTGATDVVFGGTVSGRPPALAGVEEMVGLFINTVPVRVDLDPRETAAQLMTRVQQEQAQLLDHQYVGLAEIHELAGLPELFDTMTVFESYPVDRQALAQSLDLAGMRVLDAEGTDATPYPLSLLIIPGESIQITLKYLTAAIDDARAEHVLDRLVSLLAQLSAEPDIRMTSLTLHAAPQIHGRPGVPARTFAEILADSVGRHGDRVAVRFEGTDTTYRELDRASDRLAGELRPHGARPETFVALAIPRSLDSMVAMWAVVKTGAAFVPIDPKLPAERIDRMLADCGARIGLTVAGVLPDLAADVIWLDASPDRLPTLRDRPVPTPTHLDNLAYAIFTSGSTGTPKAVAVSHRGLANFVAAQTEEFRVDADSRVLHFASPSFDASISEALMAFANGATLVIAPPSVMAGDDLAAIIETEQVSHMVITPAALATVDPLPCVRVLAVAGEAPSHDVIERWSAGRTMLNHYGPTEFTIWATGSESMTTASAVDIGVPVLGASAMILDGWLRPVADGVAGELYLAGPALARGYLNRPDLTATRFVADPRRPGRRLYRTGDVVRWDGTSLHYLGRADFQVKIRGFRVELGEIDAVLTGRAEVDFAVTIAAVGPTGDTVLVSYVLAAQGTAVDTEALRHHAADRLPGYMVPSVIQALESIPLTPVGKLDTKALPAPDFAGRHRPYRSPRTPVEQLVVDVFIDVLGLATVGIDDSFFDLGGNSLVATRVVARINLAAGSAVALRDLFEAPTPAALATRIDRDGDVHPRRRHLVAATRPDAVPLSLAQQRMWFLNRFDDASAAYNMPMALELNGSLDVDALSSAVNDVLSRHEVLRTVYPQTDDGPVQIVLPHDPTRSLEIIDVGADDVASCIAGLAAAPFDVTAEVPVRVALLRLTEDRHVIVMVMHHISGDGWSMGPLARDIVVAYSARRLAAQPRWTPLPIQYSDFAVWQRQLLGEETDDASIASTQIAFWTAELSDLPDVMELPSDRPRPAQLSYRGGRVPFAIDSAVHQRLAACARTHGTSTFMLLHSAFAVMLARTAGTHDVTVGSPVAGRGEQALDDLIGMFVNTVVLRSRIDAAMPFSEFLAQTRESDLQAFAHADVPFERIVEVLAPRRSTARHPLFQVGFSFENLMPTSVELPGLSVSQVELDSSTSQFDLHLIVVESPDAGIDGWFTYAEDLFDACSVEALGERLHRVLDVVLADPDIALGDIDLLGEDGRDRILHDWNDTHRPMAAATLPELIDRRPVIGRDAPAVMMDGTSATVTHEEFDTRSNRLARYLVGLGAGPDTLVALAMSRSIDQVIAMAAVVKAGAGYVPVDPSHPVERTALVLDSAAPLCVLTTSLDAFDGAIPVDRLDLRDVDASPLTDADRLAPLHPDNIVYVMYTSGSTGRPKGVTLTHRAVINQLLWFASEYDVDADDRFLVITPATFDVSVWQYWTPLVTGAALVLHRPGPLEPAQVLRTVADQSISILSTVPSVLDALLTEDALLESDRRAGDSLRHVVAIGEALPATVAGRMFDGPALHNLYGPTEAAVSVTAHRVDPADETPSVPIGKPEWNTQVYVLDERLHPVPVGVPGELYIAGDQLSRGYYGRPDITSERFVANPFGEPGSRLYRSGDLAAWNRAGHLDYIGRTDFQVKLRGFRIELGDIESALLRIAGVRRAVVVASRDEHGDRLVAYVVGDTEAASIIPSLGRLLPSYMVPSIVVALDELPLNVNGKVDRGRLPAAVSTPTVFRAPRSATEVAVAESYAAVLDLDNAIGAGDDFFDLGGNSLLATRVADALRTRLGCQVSVAWMFGAPTVEALARTIDAADTTSAAGSPFDSVLPLRTTAPRTTGREAPLFCIHPASGLAWCYAGLAAVLEENRGVYGIQSPELTGAETPEHLDDVVDLYLQQIRAVQPHGPYNLLGWSYGGFVAHGIAARLREVGEQVSLLAMLDPDVGSCTLVPPEPLTAGEFFDEFAPVLGIDGSGDTVSVDQAAARVRDALGTDAVDGVHIERLACSYNNALRLLAGYRPPVFDGDVVFFSARTEDGNSAAAASWAPFVTGRVADHPVDAIHDRMMDSESLQAVSAVLRPYLHTPTFAAAS
nr:non-ribosomal peptide synthetase [Rhodococcus sp. (in: high G+C Gram-positive bacteria)]